jgi:hypothetical protein
VKKQPNRWDTAISDAEESIVKMERRIEGLRFAVKVFKENRDAGVEWEPMGNAGMTAVQQPIPA